MKFDINIVINEDEIRDIQIETEVDIVNNELTFDQIVNQFDIQLDNDEYISSIVNVETDETKYNFWSILIDWSFFII